MIFARIRFRSRKRPRAEVLALEREQVESVEEGPVPPEEQGGEVALAVRPQATDLAVHDRAPGPDGVGDLLLQTAATGELDAAAGQQAATVALDDGEDL